MKVEDAKDKFIQSWGMLGSQWGINRTMSQVHALLLISPDPLSADDIMGQLNISRGNTNMNVRALIDWGLVTKVFKPGERREYFEAEKDMWLITKQVISERKKRELEPMLKMLQQLSDISVTKNDTDGQAFVERINEIKSFALQTDKIMKRALKADRKWFFSILAKLFK